MPSGVSFVSVTQQFNTTTSMGRLTLNVLLSFAQFEREVTERAHPRQDRRLQAEGHVDGRLPCRSVTTPSIASSASMPRRLRRSGCFLTLYLKLGSVRRLQEECQRLKLRTKLRTMRDGRSSGGTAFSRGHLYRILSNPIYIGRTPHKGRSYDGEHEAITDAETWDKVQAQLVTNAGRKGGRNSSKHPSLLAGLSALPTALPLHPLMPSTTAAAIAIMSSARC